MFSAFVGVFSALEHMGGGLLSARGLTEGLAELASKGWYELLAECVVISCAFVPFFAFKELEGVRGESRLRDLFWKRAAPDLGPARAGAAGARRS